MDSKRLIKERVRLKREETDFSDLDQAHQGRVLDIEGGKVIIRAANVIRDLNLKPGKEIHVVYLDNARGIYYFKGRVLNVEDPIIEVNEPNQLQKHQRRNFVRVKYETELEFSPISYKGENLTHLEDKKGAGRMVDISAGGICFISDIKLMKELVIELEFTLENNGFKILGEIVRVLEKKKAMRWELSLTLKVKG